VPAAIQRKTPSSWPVEIITVVLFMMMSTTAGATEHGLAQQMTTSQQMEWVSKLGEIQQTMFIFRLRHPQQTENKQRSRCTPTRFNISAQQNWKNGAHTTQVKTEEPEESMKQRLAVCLLSITVLAAREMSTTPAVITKRWLKMRDFMWQTASTVPASARMKKDAAGYLTENPHSARQ